MPEALLNRIKEFIENQPEFGFTSVSDFVKYATIEKLEKLMDK